jgi:hypothetical protein
MRSSQHEEDAMFPLDFIHIRQSEGFLKVNFGETMRTMVGVPGSLGVRYSYGPFAIEYYTTDTEPQPHQFRGLRIIVWDRLQRTEKPIGWHRVSFAQKLAPHAIVDLSHDTYWQSWSHGTKSHRTKWFKEHEYEIIKTDLDVFMPYFRKHARPKHLTTMFSKVLERLQVSHREVMTFFVLKNKVNGVISAGICTVDYPDVRQSYYLASFYDRENIPRQAGVWLLNYWFMRCREKGISYANLGTVWAPGQSRSWKGFTLFKQGFSPFVVAYKAPLTRITFSWK